MNPTSLRDFLTSIVPIKKNIFTYLDNMFVTMAMLRIMSVSKLYSPAVLVVTPPPPPPPPWNYYKNSRTSIYLAFHIFSCSAKFCCVLHRLMSGPLNAFAATFHSVFGSWTLFTEGSTLMFVNIFRIYLIIKVKKPLSDLSILKEKSLQTKHIISHQPSITCPFQTSQMTESIRIWLFRDNFSWHTFVLCIYCCSYIYSQRVSTI